MESITFRDKHACDNCFRFLIASIRSEENLPIFISMDFEMFIDTLIAKGNLEFEYGDIEQLYNQLTFIYSERISDFFFENIDENFHLKATAKVTGVEFEFEIHSYVRNIKIYGKLIVNLDDLEKTIKEFETIISKVKNSK